MEVVISGRVGGIGNSLQVVPKSSDLFSFSSSFGRIVSLRSRRSTVTPDLHISATFCTTATSFCHYCYKNSGQQNLFKYYPWNQQKIPRFRFSVVSSSSAHHNHHDHDHHHHHHHNHNCSGEGAGFKLTRAQTEVLRFARSVGWVRLADYLRGHLQLCCSSMALLLAAAASPYLLPKPAVSYFQNTSVLLAFPIVGVCHCYFIYLFFK